MAGWGGASALQGPARTRPNGFGFTKGKKKPRPRGVRRPGLQGGRDDQEYAGNARCKAVMAITSTPRSLAARMKLVENEFLASFG
jgi:hypothetical protein